MSDPHALSAVRPALAPPSGLAPRRRWRLVRCQPLRELTAEDHLVRQGFRVFLPKTMRTIRHARRLQARVSAFFPGYLFVDLDLANERWRSINGTIGVVGLVMRGEKPAVVPDGVVEDLIACSAELGLHLPPRPRPGQTVRILTGPFSNQLALVQRLDAEGRVRLLLDIMGGKIAIDASDIALAPV